MNATTSTVLIQRDERFQPDGIWVFINDMDAVWNVLNDYPDLDEAGINAYIDALEVMPACDESTEALGESDDGYLGECPQAWAN